MTERARSTSRGSRILHFPLLRLVVAATWLIALILPAQLARQALPGRARPLVAISSAAVVALVALLGYFVYVRVVERRPVRELARGGALLDLARGIVIGALLFTATIGVLWALGYYTVTGTSGWMAAAPAFAIGIMSAASEEVLFRGVVFRLLEEWIGTWMALAMSALLFGLLHLLNPNATLAAAVAIALEAGVLLAAAYTLTRTLWLPIGMHFAWNFVQGGIFGVAISGNKATGILQGHLAGPELLSGGAFGAEASVVAIVLGLTASALFLWRARAKNRFVRPSWSREIATAPGPM